MKILIIYATFSNGTALAVQQTAEVLSHHNHTVITKRAHDTDPEEFLMYDLVIMASPSWLVKGKEGQPHDDYFALKEKFRTEVFNNKQFAVLGLGDSTYAHFCGAVDYLEEWIRELKGNLIVPSLRVDGFYFDQEANTETIRAWAEDLSKHLQPS